ncbi:helix-turn-helix domain-containing protein [Micromonospora sp. DR5-3]|uniref:ArsR/SmtB family transcription factor n=1 Tax=unclassified Micromonospora TaxID=2617518 RepID=UPI0011D6B22A|nr:MULTISPECIES: helix-turn-helix domain-containing protein [unclassified Micromonospora]MCW3815082.1 helix-turn-helix domain-containing protein [Micromonospora sp. DR5-3]TYC25393.1 helix-turn-helix transcriptional regulator [Micromonospora sp. MP36]
MSLKNPYGDFEITDPQALRALAHPVRLAVLGHLQRHGPATATQLSPHVGATPSVVSWHLRHLASFGLVTDWDGATSRRERWWQAAAKGFRFNLPDDADGQNAARQLQGEMFAQSAELPQQWLLHDEPRLDTEWRRAAGLANTRIMLTAEEMQQLNDDVEALIARYVQRPEAEAPAGARGVRLLQYVLPEPGGDERSEG